MQTPKKQRYNKKLTNKAKHSPHNPNKNTPKRNTTDNQYVSKQNEVLIYGKHAAFAAINNKNRTINKILISENFNTNELSKISKLQPQIISNDDFNKLLPKTAVHQGIIVIAKPITDLDMTFINSNLDLILVLDKITDPQNFGSILRSAAAFGVKAILIPKDDAPMESGALAKAASGALELIPIIKVTNLVRAINELKNHGFWFIAMDGNTNDTFKNLPDIGKNIALVMGAEGSGIRHLTKQNCDFVVKIPISEQVESLNVSSATAISLYCLRQKLMNS